jgi:ketosteroid isomerase-like protein
MKRIVLALAFLGAVAGSARAADVATTTRPLNGAQAVDLAWSTAMLANDLDAVMECYAHNATMWMPGGPRIDGLDAIRKDYEQLFAVNNVKEASVSNAHYETSGNLSVGWGQFAMTLAPKAGGDEIHMSGRFTEAAMRRNGKWVYVVDHASAEPPPAEALVH